MCGRFALYSPYPKLSESLRLPLEAGEVTPRYNVPPGTFISAVRRADDEAPPVTELWGVACRTGERLALMGINTAWQLREADPKRMRRAFSVVLERIVWELRGRPAIELVHDMTAPRKQIMVSRSFGRMTSDPAKLNEAVRQHAARAA